MVKYMVKGTKLIVLSLILVGLFIIPNNITSTTIANAKENVEGNLNDSTVKLSVYDRSKFFGGSFWGDFKFLDMGDGSVRLRPISGGKIIDPNQISDSIEMSNIYTVRFIDNEGSVYYSKVFSSAYKLKKFAKEIGNVKMRYGLDSFQIIPHGRYIKELAISGTVHSNLDNQNFSKVIYENVAEKYQFRVEKDGLYAQYRNQVRIPDGKYVIKSVENQSKVLSSLRGGNIGVSNFVVGVPGYQKFNLEYDNKNKAYRIKAFDNSLVIWDINRGNNVIFSSINDTNTKEQYWYLEKAGDGTYMLVNARDTNRILNLDSNNSNISVAERWNNSRQKFSLVKA